MLKNKVKQFCDKRGLTKYRFCKDTGISEGSGYALYNDDTLIPQKPTLTKICDTYKVQPCEIIYWVEDDPD